MGGNDDKTPKMGKPDVPHDCGWYPDRQERGSYNRKPFLFTGLLTIRATIEYSIFIICNHLVRHHAYSQDDRPVSLFLLLG